MHKHYAKIIRTIELAVLSSPKGRGIPATCKVCHMSVVCRSNYLQDMAVLADYEHRGLLFNLFVCWESFDVILISTEQWISVIWDTSMRYTCLFTKLYEAIFLVNKNLAVKESGAQKQRPQKLLWRLWFDEKVQPHSSAEKKLSGR